MSGEGHISCNTRSSVITVLYGASCHSCSTGGRYPNRSSSDHQTWVFSGFSESRHTKDKWFHEVTISSCLFPTASLPTAVWTSLPFRYEGESVNRSQMDIKPKTCDIRNWGEKKFISRHILHQHWYTCPIALPVRRNPQHRSLLTVVTATSAPPFQHQRNICHRYGNFSTQLWTSLRDKHFPLQTEHIYLWMSFASSPFTHSKTHKGTLLFGNTLLEHDRPFDYWNQPLNMRTRFCYLDSHETGLCCYLVINAENLLHPLQLVYFHLWPRTIQSEPWLPL
jgi:hypothetical protein